MNIQKLFLGVLLGVSFFGCNVFAEDVKSDEAKTKLEDFRIGFKKYLEKFQEEQLYKKLLRKDDLHSGPAWHLGRYLENDLMYNVLRYKELGILDQILDIIFNEETGLTPNTLFPTDYHDRYDQGNERSFSLFFEAANHASWGGEISSNARILFKKLKKRGGDSEVPCTEYGKKISTKEKVEHHCNTLCASWDWDIESKYEHHSCNRAKNIFAKLTKKTEKND